MILPQSTNNRRKSDPLIQLVAYKTQTNKSSCHNCTHRKNFRNCQNKFVRRIDIYEKGFVVTYQKFVLNAL